MAGRCSERGASVAEGGACVDHFHAMLLLEAEVALDPAATAGGRGEVSHFYAVSSYLLQHPEGMKLRAEALDGVRRNVEDHLAGRATLAELRTRVRRAADGAVRVIRRESDAVPRWPVGAWPMTVEEVLSGGVEGYGDRVAAWASSVIRALDEAGA